MPNDQQPGQERPRPADVLGLLYHAACVVSATVTPLLRTGFGRESPGGYGLLALLGLFFVAAETRAPLLLLYLVVWFAAVVYNRVVTFRLLARGYRIHSRHHGDPVVALRLPFVRSVKVAIEYVEPLLCVAIGLVLLGLCAPLGLIWLAAGVALVVRNGIEAELVRQRLQQMQDAEIEAHYYAEHMRRRGRP